MWLVAGFTSQSPDPALVQDCVVLAWWGLKEFRGESKVTTWFYRLVKHECLRMKLFGRRELNVEIPEMGREDPTYHRIRLNQLQAGASLSPSEAQLLYDRLQEMTHSEIAENLGCTQSAVESRWNRVKERMVEVGG